MTTESTQDSTREKQKGDAKTARAYGRTAIKIVPITEALKKPSWIRVKAASVKGPPPS